MEKRGYVKRVGAKRPEVEIVTEDPLVDALDYPLICDDPFFSEVTCSLLKRNPISLLRVRHEGPHDTCWAYAFTATMYGEEMSVFGTSSEGSTQELIDHLHLFIRPARVRTRAYFVPKAGFSASYEDVRQYIIAHRLSPKSLYPPTDMIKKYRKKIALDYKWDGKVWKSDNSLITSEEKISIQMCKCLTRKQAMRRLERKPVAAVMKTFFDFEKWRGSGIYRTGEDDVEEKEEEEDEDEDEDDEDAYNDDDDEEEEEEEKAEDDDDGDTTVSDTIVSGRRPRPRLEIYGHAITLVGYGGEGRDSYFLVQNSHGLEWGHKGYVKVLMKLVSDFCVPLGTRSPQNRQSKQQ